MVLGVLVEPADRFLARTGVIGWFRGSFDQAHFGFAVGDVTLEVGRGRVDEDDVTRQVQQVRRRRKDRLGDLTQRAEQEIHRRVGGVVVEARATVDRDALL